jgi:hypothetical protein
MYSDHLILRGKNGVKWLDQWGPYAVIVNRRLYELGRAGKYALVNIDKHWVDGVYRSRAHAVTKARRRFVL